MLTPKNYNMNTRLIFSLLSAFLLFTFSGCSSSEEYESSQMKVDVELSNSKIQEDICGDYDVIDWSRLKKDDVSTSLRSYNDSCRITIRGINKDIITPFNVEYLQYDFWEFIRSHQYVVVDFGASWSGPCKMLWPILEQTATELYGIVVFAAVDVDENPLLAAEFGINRIPTVLYFRNGALVGRRVGFIPKNILIDDINKYLF